VPSGGAAALAVPAWIEQGPGPILNGQDEGLPGNPGRGDSLNNLGFTGAFIGGNFSFGQPLAYGGRLAGVPNADVFYLGAGSTIFHRVSGSIVTLGAYPGAAVHTIMMNPQNYKQVFVVDSANRVWGSFDERASWIELTANLPSLTSQVDTIEVFSLYQTIRNIVLIAGVFGAFEMRRPGAGGASWTPLSTGIPNAGAGPPLRPDQRRPRGRILRARSLDPHQLLPGGGGTGSVAVATASGARASRYYLSSTCRRSRRPRKCRHRTRLKNLNSMIGGQSLTDPRLESEPPSCCLPRSP
jgi:hypothetical protein